VSYTPRPYEEFKHFNRITKKPERVIWRGAEFMLTDQDVSKIPTDRKLIKIGTYGQLELYKIENPKLRAALECMNRRETKDKTLLSWCSGKRNYAKVTIQKSSNTKFIYSIEANENMFLKHWGWANNAWRAKIDGRPTEIIPILADRIAVKVQPGDSQVSFTYMPKDYKYSWIAFIVGLLIWFAIFFSAALNRRQESIRNKHKPNKIVTGDS